MKKFLLVNFVFLPIFGFSQYLGKIFVYTTEKGASFIPYINGERQTFVPVDTFEIELPNVKSVDLLIDFVDSNVYDIKKNIDFSQFKFRKFRIVPIKQGFWQQFRKKTNIDAVHIKPQGKNPVDKFRLKDESLKEYLRDIND